MSVDRASGRFAPILRSAPGSDPASRLRMRGTRLVMSVIAVCAVVLSANALAVEPDEILEDPMLEERAREIGRELRCVTCQSQSIDDSNAPLAKDLRIIVRERLVAGDSDEEVMAYVTARYGDYVRLKPEIRADTALLWLTPGLALLAAFGAAFFYFRTLPKGEYADGNDGLDNTLRDDGPDA